MNKTQLIEAVAAQAGLTKVAAKAAVEATFDAIAAALKKGEATQLIGFGTFSVKERAAHQGRNPSTKQAIEIPASKVPAFKAGKDLKAKVNNK